MDTRPQAVADAGLEQGFNIGELRVNPAEGEIAGPGGIQKVDPKVMDVLVMLAAHANHVVTRDELMRRLWPNVVVTDDALSRCLYELRRQLSSAGGDDRFKAMLETLPKRGYRLNAEIATVPAPAPAGPASWSKWRVPAIAAAVFVGAALWFVYGQIPGGAAKSTSTTAASGAASSIAVLPFADMSSDRDQAHLSDGVSEEILNQLNQSQTLRVIARTSSFSFRDRSMSIPEIAAKLHVTHVLEGSVRRSADRVRITARLVDASSNTQLWTGTYNRELGDLFAVQDEIASAVATALQITLAATPKRRRAPVSAEAHELFLQGEFFYNRRAPGDIERAVKYYQEALAIDSGHARAWAALAGAYSLMAHGGEMPKAQALAKQGEAARRAVDLDPSLAVGHARLSQYHWDIGDRKTGYKIWETARALDPDDPLILNFTAGLAMRAGNFEEGIEAQRRLVARDLISASPRANLGMYLQAVGRFDEAKAELRKAQELNPDFGWEIDLAIARILIAQGNFEEAKAAIATLPEGHGRDHGLALLYHAMGDRKEADAAVERLIAQSAGSPDIRLAEVHAFRASIEAAFDALQGIQAAIDRNEPELASQLWSWQLEMRVSPFLKRLHGDPRWQQLMVEPA